MSTSEFLNIFNSREQALLTWLLVFITFCGSRKEIRGAFSGVLKAFFQHQILTGISLFTIYVVAVCLLLSKIGLWSIVNLKTTLFWFIGGGVASFFSANKVSKQKHFFLHALKDQLSVMVILEFVTNIFVFNYWTELLIFPLLAYLTCMMAYAEGKSEYKPAYVFVSGILGIYGFYLLGYGLYKTVQDYHQIINQPQLIELVIVPILSISILPCVYLLALFMTYENMFLRIGFWTKEPQLAKQAKCKLLKTFNFDLKALIAFSRQHPAINVENIEDLNKISKANAYEKKESFNWS